MRQNIDELGGVIDLADDMGIDIVMVFQAIPPHGRENILELTPEQQTQLIETISEKQKTSKALIMPVCAPEYWPYIINHSQRRIKPKLLQDHVFKGCGAGRGFCYVRFDGDVWPCNFIPLSAGNVREQEIKEIWDSSAIFNDFRVENRNLKNHCGDCEQVKLCGGCRGRAYAHFQDYLEGDPNCMTDIISGDK